MSALTKYITCNLVLVNIVTSLCTDISSLCTTYENLNAGLRKVVTEKALPRRSQIKGPHWFHSECHSLRKRLRLARHTAWSYPSSNNHVAMLVPRQEYKKIIKFKTHHLSSLCLYLELAARNGNPAFFWHPVSGI